MVLAVVLTVHWIISLLYVHTERGRAARREYLARRERSQAAAAIPRATCRRR
jgi:hypothetical protein